jgi:phosphate transport system substrate-binding protein
MRLVTTKGGVSLVGGLALALSLGLAGLSCNKSDTGGGGGAGTTNPVAPVGNGERVKLKGSGATFPAPLYQQWFKDYHTLHDNVTIEYQGNGSGAGIGQFTQGLTDFGASDAAMKDEEIAKVQGGVVLLPMTAGSVVIAYNLQGVTDLNLPRDVYAKIFLGTITKWNDPALVAANPGATLPDQHISVVHRADGSGTTFTFTNHLAAISPDWKAGPGVGKDVKWPTGAGGNGNPGVTQLITSTAGSIGYVEYGFAKTSGLATALLQNKAGKFVKATPASGAASLAHIELADDLRGFGPDPDGDDSYPIVTYTWLLCHPTYSDANKGNVLKDVINYGLTEGQKTSDGLGYIPLPDGVVQKVKAKADTIKAGG